MNTYSVTTCGFCLPGRWKTLWVTFALLMIFSGSRTAIATELAMLESLTPEETTAEVSEVVVRKNERRMFLMAGDEVLRSYRIGLGDNPSGHKLYEGDERTPEGEYTLDWRNANSDFYKSIHISYPNERDRELASAWGLNPGGSIMIHGLPNDAEGMEFAYLGLDWTDGCIAVSNQEMDEIWALVSDGTPIRILP